MSDKLTRREVGRWLDQINFQLDQLIRGPAGEFRARVALLQQKIQRWRARVSPRRPEDRTD